MAVCSPQGLPLAHVYLLAPLPLHRSALPLADRHPRGAAHPAVAAALERCRQRQTPATGTAAAARTPEQAPSCRPGRGSAATSSPLPCSVTTGSHKAVLQASLQQLGMPATGTAPAVRTVAFQSARPRLSCDALSSALRCHHSTSPKQAQLQGWSCKATELRNAQGVLLLSWCCNPRGSGNPSAHRRYCMGTRSLIAANAIFLTCSRMTTSVKQMQKCPRPWRCSMSVATVLARAALRWRTQSAGPL